MQTPGAEGAEGRAEGKVTSIHRSQQGLPSGAVPVLGPAVPVLGHVLSSAQSSAPSSAPVGLAFWRCACPRPLRLP